MAKKSTKEAAAMALVDLEANTRLLDDLAIINALQVQVDAIGTQCLQIQIVDDSTLAIGQQNLSKANSIAKSIEDSRKKIKEPYLSAGKLIDSTCAKLTETIEKGMAHIKSEVGKWEKERLAILAAKQAEIDAKAKEEDQKRIAEEIRKQDILTFISNTLKPYLQSTYEGLKSAADCDKFLTYINKNFPGVDKFQEYLPDAIQIRDNYIDLIKGKKAQFSAAANISDTELALLKQKEKLAILQQELDAEKLRIKQAEEAAEAEKKRKEAEELAMLEKAKLQAQSDLEKTKGVRYIWKFELVDIEFAPKEWLTIDEAKVKEYMKANKDSLKDNEVINGIKFYKESSVVA